MENNRDITRKRRFADFQNSYRRSSNFGYGSKRDRFAIAGNGELLFSEGENEEDSNI